MSQARTRQLRVSPNDGAKCRVPARPQIDFNLQSLARQSNFAMAARKQNVQTLGSFYVLFVRRTLFVLLGWRFFSLRHEKQRVRATVVKRAQTRGGSRHFFFLLSIPLNRLIRD